MGYLENRPNALLFVLYWKIGLQTVNKASLTLNKGSFEIDMGLQTFAKGS